MKKKILSVLLAGALTASIATVSASALLNADGSYTPGEGVETFRYYCAVPGVWFNEETEKIGNTAGLYWWNGTDACGAVDGSGGSLAWPGYKANKAEDEENVTNLFYLDVPVGYTGDTATDVPTVVWNNYLNGGTDKEAPIYTLACQAADAATEYLSEGDSDTYDDLEGFWDMVYEAAEEEDFSVFGDYASNFEYVEESFIMDNMVYVMDLSKTSENFEGKMTFVGDWYFYYGDGEYGNWPTKELAEENADAEGTIFGNFTDEEYTGDTPVAPAPAEPDTTDPAAPAPTTPNNNTGNGDKQDATKPSVPAPSDDVKSSTDDTANAGSNNSNGAVPTGSAPLASVTFLAAASFGAVVFLNRKRTKE